MNALYSTLGTPVVIPVNTIGNLGDPNNCSDYLNGTDYVGNIEYTFSNDCGDYQYDLSKIYNSEGYVDNFYYTIFNYYRRDHLGNNREVWRAPWSYGSTNYAASTIQRTQYYPSGLPWASNSGDNPWMQNKKYNGKEFVEMHGWDVSNLGWRVLYNARLGFDSFDPDAEIDYDISPYAACHNNPVLKVDPNGRWVETAWDVFSLATGAKSFVDNVRQGNVGAATLDGVGVVADAAAVVIPLVPGGVGAGIKAVRVGDKVLDAVHTGKTTEKVVEGGKVLFIKE
ncbi:MAG: hypothetical protein Q8T08_09590 [Ignavibacteria bacterium]|nr:hypothetical protein [Ignavibacteria bacterium]